MMLAGRDRKKATPPPVGSSPHHPGVVSDIDIHGHSRDGPNLAAWGYYSHVPPPKQRSTNARADGGFALRKSAVGPALRTSSWL
jgi:hypothetical protein